MRFEQALESFVRQLEADGRSPHTIGQYQRHVRKLAQYFQEHAVEEIGHEDLARFLSSNGVRQRAGGGPRKASSANALRTSVRCFFGYLHAAGCLRQNPARLVRRARVGPRVPRGLTPSELVRLRTAFAGAKTWAEMRDVALLTLLLESGMRIGSALALDVGDLDLAGGEARLRTMKGGGEQVVFLTGTVVERITDQLMGRTSGAVFTSQDGGRIGSRQVHRRLEMWCARAGLGRAVGPHGLRHTFAMGVYARTRDVLVVQAALGHRSIESTMPYAWASRGRVREAVAGVSDAG